MRENVYINTLREIIHKNYMFEYEEVNLTFIAAKLIHLQEKWGRKIELILRSDFINDITYWFIRYFRSKSIEPVGILSTSSNKKEYQRGILGIPILLIDEMDLNYTKNKVLLIINRESDQQIFSQKDYREIDYGFYFRARGNLQFFRKRGSENYFHILQNEEQYYELLDILEDIESKISLIEVIRSLLENDIYRYHEYKTEEKYFDNSIYEPLENEVWVNCGSCTGDTILHYLASERNFSKIYAVEIDTDMIMHIKNMLSLFPKRIQDKIEVYDRCLGGNRNEYSIDSLFGDKKVSLINMDIEGSEMTVLEGAIETIKKDRPVLAVAAYHKAQDLLSIPQLIYNYNRDYHIYFRKYKGYCPDALNEYIYYAVPGERMVKK